MRYTHGLSVPNTWQDADSRFAEWLARGYVHAADIETRSHRLLKACPECGHLREACACAGEEKK